MFQILEKYGIQSSARSRLGVRPIIFSLTGGFESATASVIYIPGKPDFTLTSDDSVLLVSVTGVQDGFDAVLEWEYQIDGGDWENTNTSSTQFSIIDLNNDQEYDIKIRGINSVGIGIESDTVQGTPEETTTPGAPVIDSIDELFNALRVNFTEPADDGGSIILGYKYRIDGGTPEDIGDAQDNFLIEDATPGTPLDVEMLAYNENGDGAWSNLVQATPEGLLQESTDYINRVEADSGAIVDAGIVNTIYAEELDKTRLSDLYLGFDSNAGLKITSGDAEKIYDLGGNDRDIVPGASDRPGVESLGLHFNENSFGIPGTDQNTFLQSWSVSFWARPDTVDSFMGIIGRISGTRRGVVYMNTNSNTIVFIDDDVNFVTVGTGVTLLNAWNFITVTGENDTVTCMINGVQQTPQSVTGSDLNLERIGRYGSSNYYLGLLDRFLLHNTVISESDHQSIYNQSKDRYE